MQFRTTTAAALALALAAAVPARADDVPPAKTEAPWVDDFDKAVETAKKEGKDLLVDFTGSDWCGWCIKLHEEVFSHDDFLAAAKKDYVLVALDFPHAEAIRAKVPNPERNKELAQKYGVESYPTVLLVTPDGDVFGRTGYQEGGSAKYVEHIAKLRADGLPALKSAKDIVAAVAAASDAEKPAAYEKAVAALSALEPGAASAQMLSAPAKAAFDSDPENKSGLRAKAAHALLKSQTGDESVIGAATLLDPKNEQGLLELALLAKGPHLRTPDEAKALFAEIEALFAGAGPKDTGNARQLAIAGMSLARNSKVMNDPAKAKEYAKRIRDLGYDGDERLKAFVEKLLADEPKDK